MAASKYQFITELYRRTGATVARNPQSTAVLEFDDWNKKFMR